MDQQALLEAVRRDPAGRASRLVYADWLDDHGDPLADYIRAECDRLACPPDSPPWLAATDRLIALTEQVSTVLGGWEYVPDLDRIRARIDRFLAWEGRHRVFGVEGHHCRLLPTLAEPDLLRFERRHGLALPGEYRAFLLRVANGEMGPSYGLDPLDLGKDYDLACPFPVSSAEAARLIAHSLEASCAAEASWTGGGCLCLTHHGCGNYSLLVVNGPLRGNMWISGDCFIPDFKDDDQPIGFLAWYEQWLDSELPAP
jgi:uncharacterized protein (TIGR02996 family)